MPKIIDIQLIEEFKDRDSFTRDELFKFFQYFEPDLKESTFGWRIYDLKKRSIIKQRMRGLYAISYKPKYKPAISTDLLKLARKINDRFEDVKYCIWETNWLNEFSQHQSGKKIYVIEVEKDFLEPIFYELKENFKYDVYLSPDEKAINFYIAEGIRPIVIKKIVSRSPLCKRIEGKIKFNAPSLEKILVDIFSEDKLFYYSQGIELVHIFENAIKSYDINYTKLYSYAKRRERDNDIKLFLNNNMQYLIKDIIYV